MKRKVLLSSIAFSGTTGLGLRAEGPVSRSNRWIPKGCRNLVWQLRIRNEGSLRARLCSVGKEVWGAEDPFRVARGISQGNTSRPARLR